MEDSSCSELAPLNSKWTYIVSFIKTLKDIVYGLLIIGIFFFVWAFLPATKVPLVCGSHDLLNLCPISNFYETNCSEKTFSYVDIFVENFKNFTVIDKEFSSMSLPSKASYVLQFKFIEQFPDNAAETHFLFLKKVHHLCETLPMK